MMHLSEGWKQECPRQESNLRTWLRRPMLYPLSYGGLQGIGPSVSLPLHMNGC